MHKLCAPASACITDIFTIAPPRWQRSPMLCCGVLCCADGVRCWPLTADCVVFQFCCRAVVDVPQSVKTRLAVSPTTGFAGALITTKGA